MKLLKTLTIAVVLAALPAVCLGDGTADCAVKGAPWVVNIPGDLPYNDSGTTCGKLNDYDATACSTYYDNGEDVFYELIVAGAGDYDITLSGTLVYTGFMVLDACPPDGTETCVHVEGSSSADPSGTVSFPSAGTYWLMIDTWPSPPCSEYTLDIAAPAPEACCYGNGSCDDILASACATAGGVAQGAGTTCAGVTCPVAPPNDTCATATMVTGLPYNDFQDTSLTVDDSDPAPSCNSSATALPNDIWYTIETLNICELELTVDYDPGARYDGLTGIYSGPDCGNLTELDCLDSGVSDDSDTTVILTEVGTVYWIQAGDWGTTPGGGPTTVDLVDLLGDCDMVPVELQSFTIE